MKGPGYRQGVPTPYVAHVHPYPTRFHGGIWTRPVFGMPSQQQTSSVFIPGRDIDMQPDRPYTGPGIQGLGQVGWDVGDGVFRPGGYGGGVFDGNLAGAPALGKRGRGRALRGFGDLPAGVAPASASDQTNFPFGKYSAQTLQLQQKINALLGKYKLCPLIADGKLGAATCGAAIDPRILPDSANQGISAPTTCEAYTQPLAASTGCGTGPKPAPSSATTAALAPSAPMSSSTKKVIGFVAGGLGAVALVYYMKKRRSR